MATPKEVRNELKKRNLPYKIAKGGGSWYVYGGAETWKNSSLCTWSLDGLSAKAWVDLIEDMAKNND